MVDRTICMTLIAIGLFAADARIAHGQTFPIQPVRVLVGFAPGGTTDIPARTVSTKLGELWGSPVLVDNRPGAGGSLAAGMVAKSPADGYTLLLCNLATHGINSALYKKLSYDAVADFTPIGQIGTAPNVLVVHPSMQAKSMAELLVYAKANSGKLNLAHAGVGSSQHLSIELLRSMTGTDIVHVPYKGGAPALSDVIGGQVPGMIAGLPTALAAIKAGKVRALSVTTAARSPHAPDVPTIAESGVPEYEVTNWSGLCAPAGLPKPLLTKLNADLQQVLIVPETRQRLADQGVDASPMTPEQFASKIKAELVKWARLIRDAGITPE